MNSDEKNAIIDELKKAVTELTMLESQWDNGRSAGSHVSAPGLEGEIARLRGRCAELRERLNAG